MQAFKATTLLSFLQKLLPAQTWIVIDMGSATTKLRCSGSSKIFSIPSFVAWSRSEHAVTAVGHVAEEIRGKHPGTIEVLQLVRYGQLQHTEATIAFLHTILSGIWKRSWWMPMYIIGKASVIVPAHINPVQKRAYQQILRGLGVLEVEFLPLPVAITQGLSTPLSETTPQCIIDCGEGKTEVSVVVGSTVLFAHSIPTAGEVFTRLIQKNIHMYYKVDVGWQVSEALKLKALKQTSSLHVIRGRNTQTHLPESITVSSKEVLQGIETEFDKIVLAVSFVLSQLDADIVSEIQHQGITVCGGGSQIPLLIERLQDAFKTHIHTPSEWENVSVQGVK